MNPFYTCAFTPCAQADACCLPGGCVQRRFPQPEATRDRELPKQQALNGTKPARASRDPRFIKRRRKPLTR